MSMTNISCPHCGVAYQVAQGAAVVCPECGKTPAQGAAGSALMPPPPMPPVPPPVPVMPMGGGAIGAGQRGLEYGTNMAMTWWDQAQKAFARHSDSVRVSIAEQVQLNAIGVLDPSVQKHFVWRRSLLWFIIVPTFFTAVLKTIGYFTDNKFETLSGLGITLLLIQTLAFWAIPITSLLAARQWARPAASRRVLLIGFLIAFPIIIITSLVPLTKWIKMDEALTPQQLMEFQMAVGLLGGLAVFAQCLPTILSLLPGSIRACVRIKVLFPESIVSGWLMIAMIPLYALFLATLFLLVNQIAGNFLLILGMLGLVAAPVAYMVRMRLFIRPLWDDVDREKIAKAQYTYLMFLGVAAGLLLIYAFTVEIMGKKLIGYESEGAMFTFWKSTWTLVKFTLEYLGRSLFITCIAMDWFLLINVSVWRNTREFEQSAHAGEYEKTLANLGESLTH